MYTLKEVLTFSLLVPSVFPRMEIAALHRSIHERGSPRKRFPIT